jgi:hypothetical protein
MGSWRDQILREFTPQVARLTVVSDPDGILLEEGLLEGIYKRGFELIPFDDHVTFRYAYESHFRSRWDKGEETDLVVVLRSNSTDINNLPFDLLQAGRRLAFSLGEIFPNLSYPLLTALDRGDLDALFTAQVRHAPGQLGDNATKEFVLRHVFEIAPELIKNQSDLLRVLLRRHYRRERIPKVLDDRFIQILRQNVAFADWPLESIIPDALVFFQFLQERWPVFLDRLSISGSPDEVCAPGSAYGIKYTGPLDLPFDHHDVKVYMDNLFAEGLLHPIRHAHGVKLAKTWAAIGVVQDRDADWSRRIETLLSSVTDSIPGEDVRHLDWLLFARKWAELVAVFHQQSKQSSFLDKICELQAKVDTAFAAWITRRYAGLVNLPPQPPVMPHHIARSIARDVDGERNFKVALVVVDGLSLDQWMALRDAMTLERNDLAFNENAVFAWIPSITSVSRQAIFSGKAPLYFPASIRTTDKEPALWNQFWAGEALQPHEIAYIKGLGDGSLENVEEILSDSRVRAFGVVVDKVDRIMHGMELGTAGMHNQIRQWAERSYLSSLLAMLLDRGFHVYLTSDHGNVEAVGCGRPSEGSLADIRGERVRLYPDTVLRNTVKTRLPETIEWEPIGLPDSFFPLLAPTRKAFVTAGSRTVGHGGAAIEEVIVPFVRVMRKSP